MFQIISQVFQVGYSIYQQITGNSAAASVQAQIAGLQNAVGELAQFVNAYLQAIAGGLADMGTGWTRASEANVRYSDNMEQAWRGMLLAIDLLVTDTIPATIHHLEGKVVSQHISRLDSLVGNRASRKSDNLWGWRNGIVDPTIRDERSLRKAFTNFMGDWLRFAGWMGGVDRFPQLPGGDAKSWIAGLAYAWTHPSSYMDLLFSRRSSDSGGPYSVATSWLADGSHQGALDDLLALLIDSSTDRYRHILTAGEAILNSPYP